MASCQGSSDYTAWQAMLQGHEMRAEAVEQLVLMLHWVAEPRKGLGPRQLTALINSAAAIATHRNQFFESVCTLLAQLLGARFPRDESGWGNKNRLVPLPRH